MNVQFRTKSNVQLITLQELNTFQTNLGMLLPEDYRHHMLQFNGGIAEPDNLEHTNYPEMPSTGLDYLFSIKYGSLTVEYVYDSISQHLPEGYLPIGKNRGGGEIIMSLNNDSTYGEIKEWYPDDEMNYMSSSFKQYLEDMQEGIDRN